MVTFEQTDAIYLEGKTPKGSPRFWHAWVEDGAVMVKTGTPGREGKTKKHLPKTTLGKDNIHWELSSLAGKMFRKEYSFRSVKEEGLLWQIPTPQHGWLDNSNIALLHDRSGLIVSQSMDRRISTLWCIDIETGKKELLYETDAEGISNIWCCADRKICFSTLKRCEREYWKLDLNSREITGYHEIRDISEDGKRVVTVSGENRIEVRDSLNDQILAEYELPKEQGCTVGISPNGKQLAIGTSLSSYADLYPSGDALNFSLLIFDIDTGVVTASFDNEFSVCISHIVWLNDNRTVITRNFHSYLQVWDSEKGELNGDFRSLMYPYNIALSPNRRYFISHDSSTFMVSDLLTNSSLFQATEFLLSSRHSGTALFAGNGKIVRTGCGIISLWQTGLDTEKATDPIQLGTADKPLYKPATLVPKQDPEIAQFHKACLIGDLEKVKSLLEETPSLIDARDNYGYTALHCADSKEMAAFLIEKGADVNAETEDGITPLHCISGNSILRLLIKNGAGINHSATNGDTPLHSHASEQNGYPAVKLLLSKGADPHVKNNAGYLPVDFAVNREEFKKAELLKSYM